MQEILERKIKRLEKEGREFRKPIDEGFVDLFLKTFKLPLDLKSSVVEYLSLKPSTPLVWLSLSECTGCTESLLRNEIPGVESLFFDFVQLDYHEVLMMDSGFFAQKNLHDALKNDFLLVVEGGVCVGEGEFYATFGAKALSAKQELDHVMEAAKVIFGVGSCAAFGGVQAAYPNPSHTASLTRVLSQECLKRYVCIPGCPPSDLNIVMNLVYAILFDQAPERDFLYRPLWAYGKSVHSACERKARFEAGDFVDSFHDERLKEGYCLYKVGCKGPYAYNNCAKMKFNHKTSWPIQAGHGCVACSEPDFWDNFGTLEQPMRRDSAFFAKRAQLPELLELSRDKEEFLRSLCPQSIGIFLDTKQSLIVYQNENILQFSFESNPRLFLQALEQKSKLTKTLVANYKRDFQALYERVLDFGEQSRISENVGDVLAFVHQLIAQKPRENEHLSMIEEALGFDFMHVSDMEFSSKVVGEKIVIDVSRGLRLSLIYLLGGLEYSGIAYGVLGTLCEALRSGVREFAKSRDCQIVLGGDLAQNALVQKWILQERIYDVKKC